MLGHPDTYGLALGVLQQARDLGSGLQNEGISRRDVIQRIVIKGDVVGVLAAQRMQVEEWNRILDGEFPALRPSMLASASANSAPSTSGPSISGPSISVP